MDILLPCLGESDTLGDMIRVRSSLPRILKEWSVWVWKDDNKLYLKGGGGKYNMPAISQAKRTDTYKTSHKHNGKHCSPQGSALVKCHNSLVINVCQPTLLQTALFSFLLPFNPSQNPSAATQTKNACQSLFLLRVAFPGSPGMSPTLAASSQ